MTDTRTIIVAFVLGGLLAVGAFAAMGGVTADNHEPEAQAQNPDEHITVTASGAADAEPDSAVVTLAVEVRHEDPSVARERVARGADEMRDALEAAGYTGDDVQTTDFGIREERLPREAVERGEDPDHFGYHEFEVTADDPEDAGDVIDVAVDHGATTVSDVSFTLSDEQQAELKQEALETAMENARMQADAVAAAGNVNVVGVRSASTADTRFSPVSVDEAYLAAEADVADDAATDIDPGPVDVDAQVKVVYDLSG